MKKKYRDIILLLIFGIVLAVYAYQFCLQTQPSYTTTIKTPTDPNVIYAQDITTDESRIEIAIEHQPNDYSPNRYDLKITPYNTTATRYGYILALDSYSDALIHDSSRAEISYSENYSAGERDNQNNRYYFEPNRKECDDSSAGTLSLRLLHNTHTIPETGIAKITVTIYKPGTQREIHTITEEIWFPIE